MLRLIEGGFYSSLHEEVINEIKRSVAKCERVYLIVPEQQTVLAECEMSEIFTPSDSLVFEVTNFTRFTNTAFRSLGGISGEYCNSITKSLIMWKTLTELSAKLAITEKSPDVSAGVVKKALSAIGEMQSLGIGLDELGEALGKEIDNKRLFEKLEDLYSIFELYTKNLGERYNDTANDCTKLAELIKASPEYLENTDIYIEGFTSFTKPQQLLIETLVRYATVTVALPIDRLRRSAFEYREVAEARRKLINGVGEGLTDNSKNHTMRHRAGTSELLAELSEMLWSFEDEIDNNCLQELVEVPDRVRIFSAPTIYEECDFVAADIKRRIMEGDSPSDFAVVARDIKSYIGVIDVSFDSTGIPYFLSKSDDISSTSLIKHISTAYAVATGGFRLESVMTYMKSGLISTDSALRDELELYLEKWNIDGRRLGDPMPFNMNPRGYTMFREGDDEKLARINATRSEIITPLIDFGEEITHAETVKDHATALLDFLRRGNIPEMLKRRAAALVSLGEAALAEETLSMWGVVCDALDVLVNVLGDVKCNSEAFLNQLKVALSGAVVGRIPAYRDAVTIGSADMLRINEKKHIYLIGVNVGEFPATVSDNSYFTEQDKRTLNELGLEIEPDLEVKCARECYSFSRAFAKAKESVTLIYTEKTAMTKPIAPSEVVGRIVALSGKRIEVKRVTELAPLERIYTTEAALNALGSASEEDGEVIEQSLIMAGLGDRIKLTRSDIRNTSFSVGEDALALIYGDSLYLSETKISAFTSCPMKYFLKYGIGLSDNEEAEINALVIGSFVHGVVEKIFKINKKNNVKLSKMSDADRDRLTEECAEEYVKELFRNTDDSASTKVTIARLARATKPVVAGLARELDGSGYEPKFFEIKIDERREDAPSPVVIDDDRGGKIVLGGVIDRIDTFESGGDVYVKVADYKTGQIDFKPSKLKDGEYLQMFIYLRALTETRSERFLERLGVEGEGRAIPAGVIYIKTEMKDEKVRSVEDEPEVIKKLYDRDGMLLDDEVSIAAMNPDFLPPMPEKPTKAFQPRLYDSEGWKEICDTVDDVVRGIASEIRSGSVVATPAKKSTKSCNYCPYKEICRDAKIVKTFN